MHDLLVTPEEYRKHIERATASFGSITLFGQRATTHDDFWTTVSEVALCVTILTGVGRLRGYGSCTTYHIF